MRPPSPSPAPTALLMLALAAVAASCPAGDAAVPPPEELLAVGAACANGGECESARCGEDGDVDGVDECLPNECADDAGCAAGESCVERCGATCQPPAPEGEPCSEAGDTPCPFSRPCEPALECVPVADSDDPLSTCVEPLGDGEACQLGPADADGCAAGFVCEDDADAGPRCVPA